MAKPKVRTRFTPMKPESIIPEGKSKTQQNMAADTDINVIVNRFKKGIPLPSREHMGVFGEVPSQTYHEMLNHVLDVDTQFDSLPAKVRARFRNDPFQLIRFLEDPKNHPEAMKLGLLTVPDGFVMSPNGKLVTEEAALKSEQDEKDAAILAEAKKPKPSGGLPNGDK